MMSSFAARDVIDEGGVRILRLSLMHSRPTSPLSGQASICTLLRTSSSLPATQEQR